MNKVQRKKIKPSVHPSWVISNIKLRLNGPSYENDLDIKILVNFNLVAQSLEKQNQKL